MTRAIKRRETPLAEAICLIIAILAAFATLARLADEETSSWAVRVTADGSSLTTAGWWCMVVSNPIFWFLLLRLLWRHHVWVMMLRDLASLELRLVVTHPDGRSGLAFIGQYPNAYTTVVFAVSCGLGAAVAQESLDLGLTATTYGYVLAGWLVIVLALFACPLLAFRKHLVDLKVRTLLACSAQATRYHRAVEREILGRNMSAAEDAESVASQEIPDPSKEFAAAKKLSPIVVSRLGLLPVASAALLPMIAAAGTQLPIKEIFVVAKRLLFL